MAELSLPKLQIQIEADGSAAIREIEQTSDAIEQAVDGASRRASGAADGLSEMGSAAQRAGKEIKGAGDEAKNFGDQTDAAAKKASKSLKEIGEGMSKAGKAMTAAVTVPIVAAMTASVSGASDLTETLGKTEVVFGGMTDSVLDWSNSSVSAMGLAQQTALDMASSYGDLATGMGMTQGQAAEMSMNLVQLAADMASFKNLNISDVNSAMTAVFTGETESLKRLGIVMTQTNLEQFALTQGITKQVSEMSQAEQVQLRYQYVMAMTANAQGDFARTGGNLANKSRALVETIKQTAAGFGELLVPAVTSVVSTLQEGVQWLNGLDDGTKNTILTIAMVVAAVGPLLMVGGKVLTMVQSIQAALAVMAANPVLLAIAGVTAAVAGLAIAVKSANKDVDTTSESYQNLKRSIEGGASGEVTIDASQIDDLNQNPPTITIDADGQAALSEARSIVQSLASGEYDGMLAIDGDPAKAMQALMQLAQDIAAVEEAISIGGDPAEAEQAIANLESSIAAIEGMVVLTEDPEARAVLEAQLATLRGDLAVIKGNVRFEMSDEDQSDLDSLKEKLDSLPEDKTYKNTGEFVISGATAEAITEYATAVAAAATATGNYATAVEALNNIVDQEKQRKIAEVNAQTAESWRLLTAQLNDGVITQEEYDAAIAKTIEDGNAQIRQIETEAEAQKKLNEKFNNGSLKDDPAAASQWAQQLFADEHLTQQNAVDATRNLVNNDYGDDDLRKRIDAQTTYNGLVNDGYNSEMALQDAIDARAASYADADNIRQNGANVQKESIERAEILQEGLDAYGAMVATGTSAQDAIDATVERLGGELDAYEGLEQEMRDMLAGESGEGITYGDTLTKYAELDTMISGWQSEIEDVAKRADQMEADAEAVFAGTVASLQEGFSSAEASASLALAEAAGAEMTDMGKRIAMNGKSLPEDIAKAIESGDRGQIDAAVDSAMGKIKLDTEEYNAQGMAVGEELGAGAEEAIGAAASGMGTALVGSVTQASSTAKSNATSQGKTIGSNLMAGIRSGINAGTPSAVAAARASVRATIDGGKNEARVASPSRATRDEIGVMLPRGVGVGIESETPKTVKTMRSSVSQIITGAAAEIPDTVRRMRESASQLISGGMAVAAGGYPVAALAAAGGAPGPGVTFDYDRLGDAIAQRPSYFNIGAKRLAAATRDETSRQQAVRVREINAGYGGR